MSYFINVLANEYISLITPNLWEASNFEIKKKHFRKQINV